MTHAFSEFRVIDVDPAELVVDGEAGTCFIPTIGYSWPIFSIDLLKQEDIGPVFRQPFFFGPPKANPYTFLFTNDSLGFAVILMGVLRYDHPPWFA